MELPGFDRIVRKLIRVMRTINILQDSRWLIRDLSLKASPTHATRCTATKNSTFSLFEAENYDIVLQPSLLNIRGHGNSDRGTKFTTCLYVAKCQNLGYKYAIGSP